MVKVGALTGVLAVAVGLLTGMAFEGVVLACVLVVAMGAMAAGSTGRVLAGELAEQVASEFATSVMSGLSGLSSVPGASRAGMGHSASDSRMRSR